jgi:hypothetical protein
MLSHLRNEVKQNLYFKFTCLSALFTETLRQTNVKSTLIQGYSIRECEDAYLGTRVPNFGISCCLCFNGVGSKSVEKLPKLEGGCLRTIWKRLSSTKDCDARRRRN